MVDQFLATKRRRGDDTSSVGSVPGSTGTPFSFPSKPAHNMENKAPDNSANDNNKNNNKNEAMVPRGSRVTLQSARGDDDGKRRSARERKKDVSLSRSRVRYDMQLVPPARRHRAFLDQFPIWWMNDDTEKSNQPRQSSRLLSSHDQSLLPLPFQEDTSVVWIPTKRTEWEDTVSEMTAVCTSAAIRRFQAGPREGPTKPFHAPLSRVYIRDRIDIDDPLNGYQIRHKTGGWLQGFILWTNFTTWTHSFKWDSLHPLSGFTAASSRGAKVDADGSLSNELEAQARSGDPMEGGIVFPSIAEIALLGGLGCGEYLLRMALDEIRAKKVYKYVVMQATDQSKTFYERYGFIRVGAICRYGIPTEDKEVPIMGYRHWTHANESETSLQMHGGPSYMMCLKLPDHQDAKLGSPCGKVNKHSSTFINEMLTLRVDKKPTIEQLGGSFTPGPKQQRRISATASVPEDSCGESISSAKKPKTRSLTASKRKNFGTKRTNTGDDRSVKRRKQSYAVEESTGALELAAPHLEHIPAKPLPAQDAFVDSETQIPWLTLSPMPEVKVLPPPPPVLATNSMVAADNTTPTVKDADVKKPDEKICDSVVPDFKTCELIKAETKTSQAKTPDNKKKKKQQQQLESNKLKPQKKRSSKKAKSTSDGSANGTPRPFYSVRGADGRFVTLSSLTGEPVPSAKTRSPSSPPRVKPPATASSPPDLVPPSIMAIGRSDGQPVSIIKSELLKQKVRSYPRSRVHYFNRVVKPANGPAQYFFVLHYNESAGTIRIAPMEPRGKLTGKREGKPRYQVALEDTDVNFKTANISEYEVVPATMVMKTPVIANEAWDIEE